MLLAKNAVLAKRVLLPKRFGEIRATTGRRRAMSTMHVDFRDEPPDNEDERAHLEAKGPPVEAAERPLLAKEEQRKRHHSNSDEDSAASMMDETDLEDEL